MNAKSANRRKRHRNLVTWAIAAGMLGAVPAVRADMAMAWGANSFGQLGNGSTNASNVPVAVGGMGHGVTFVAGGRWHGLAVQNGVAFAWGLNEDGQLGNGSNTNSDTPVWVNYFLGGVSAVSGGRNHSLVIQNGGVRAWGSNASGQLGNQSTVSSNTPVYPGLEETVWAVSAGDSFSLVIQEGAAKSWGLNVNGQLGRGNFTNSTVPVQVSGLTSDVSAISAGYLHALAVQGGQAKAWGNNLFGQLGNGTAGTNINTPVNVNGLTAGVTAVAAGYAHSLAIQNGNVYAWGANDGGQLGNGSNVQSNTPVLALNTSVDLISVAASWDSSYAVSADGSLWVWGKNTSGKLGLGNNTSSFNTPQQLQPPGGYVFTGIDADAWANHAVATLRLKGDATRNDAVTFDDLLIVAQYYGQTTGATWALGDFNGDRAVNFDDLLAVAQNYGVTLSAAEQAQLDPDFAADWTLARTMTPEPAGFIALTLFGGVFRSRRRRDARA